MHDDHIATTGLIAARHRVRCPDLLLALAAAWGVAAHVEPSRAFSTCVTSAAELQQALTDASDGGVHTGENTSIAVAAGTYATGAATGNGPFHYSSTGVGSLTIEGGYDANCNYSPSAGTPAILDGQHATAVLSLRSTNSNISLVQLTIQNGESTSPGAGLQINYQVSGSADAAQLYGLIIRNNHTTSNAGGLYAENTSLYGTVISGNSADGQFGGGFVTANTFQLIYKVTVAKNTAGASSNPIGGLLCANSGSCRIYDSIFWNNTNYGLYLQDAGALLEYNDYGMRGGTAPTLEKNRLQIDPQFGAPNAGDFHLAAGSPALSYGVSPGGSTPDPDGRRIPSAGAVDLGAYEDTIFGDGYEGGTVP